MTDYSPFSWDSAERPIIALAPMAGVTDASYRQLIKTLTPEVVLYTELLSTDAIHFGAKKTMGMIHFDKEKERPFVVQLFGKKPEFFLSAAKIVEEMGADGIDINMGCPASKVVSSCHGSALIRNPDLAAELVAATKKEVKIPVSVKTRLGWEDSDTLIPFCQKLIEAGADALAIHGRTYHEKFSGKANWDPIYELKKEVSVPVLGNGDIKTPQDAIDKIGNLDGVMVGRATMGNPWIMKDIADALRSQCAHVETRESQSETCDSQVSTCKCDLTPTIEKLSFEEKIPLILEHCELSVSLKGEERGMMEMRKHLASYVKGIEGAGEMRAKLVRVENIAQVKKILGV